MHNYIYIYIFIVYICIRLLDMCVYMDMLILVWIRTYTHILLHTCIYNVYLLLLQNAGVAIAIAVATTTVIFC